MEMLTAGTSEKRAAPDRCFACGRRILGLKHCADTRDDQWVFVGPECIKKIKGAGARGYQPPKGGPRLWLCEPS